MNRYTILRRSSDSTVVLCCGIVSAIVALTALFVPPFHTLTHEFAALFTILTGFAVYCVSASRGPAVGALGALAALIGALLVILVANATRFHCNALAGLPHLLITWTPAVALSLTAGTLVTGTGLRIRLVVPLGFITLNLAHDALQLYFGPRILPVDFFLGDLNGLSQRSGMDITEVHAHNRAFLAAVAAWLWFAFIPHPRTARVVTGIAVALVAVTFWGSYMGVGIGRANLRAVNPEVHSAGSVVVSHSGSPQALRKLDAVVREAQWNIAELSGLWGIETSKPVRIVLFDSRHDLERFTGLREPHAGLYEIFTDLANATGEPLRHELVHALHQELDPNPRVLLSRGFLEGTATAFANFLAESPGAHELQSAALAEGHLPHAAALVSVTGFRGVAEHSAYTAAGSFFGFLVLEHGVEAFIELQQSLDFAAVYGKTIDELDAEWRAFLQTVDVSEEAAQRAQFIYDPVLNPGFAAARCPKVGTLPDPLRDEAEYLWMTEQYADAAEAWASLYGFDNSTNSARRAVRAYEEAGQYDDALALLDRLAGVQTLRLAERAAVVADRVRILLRARDWDGLYAVYDERAAGDLPVAFGSRMGETCLRDPLLRVDYAAMLFESDPVLAHGHWQSMFHARPDFPALVFLYATAGAVNSESLRLRIDAVVRAAELGPDYADRLGDGLWPLYEDAMAEREYESAQRVCDALTTLCSREHLQFLGDRGARRIARERDFSLRSQ